MIDGVLSNRMQQVQRLMEVVIHQATESRYAQHGGDPGACDFMLGNPQEMPLTEFWQALQRWSVPQNKDWFAYKNNERPATTAVAESLQQRLGLPFEEADIFLTNGAFGALAVVLNAITDPGDEIIFISPPWFFYEAMIVTYGGKPVRVHVDPHTFNLDLAAIEAAITPRTRAVIVNTPHNPTGKIYPPATLEGLARILKEASQRIGRSIAILSDESYCRIVYDGRQHHSPAGYYPHTFVIYTYGKTLLTPGQRLGYIALPPSMPYRERVRPQLFTAQFMTGYNFPNALLQHALPDLEKLSIDVSALQRKRDRMVPALREMGYEVNPPEGTFYLLVRSPWEDEIAFCDLLAEQNVFCLPGRAAELPGYFRISLTATEEMIERALPAFAAARQKVPQL